MNDFFFSAFVCKPYLGIILKFLQLHGQNQGGGWKQGKEVGLAGVGGRGEEKMQTTVIEQK